jgi:hypothetical protein
MRMREEDLIPLGDLLSVITGVPPSRLAGFVVMIGVFEEDEKPGGRLIASTPNLRTVAHMLEIAGAQVQDELDKLSGLS